MNTLPERTKIAPTGHQTKPMINNQHTSLADFIWKNADDLWGNFKHVDFGKIILPFTLLRRLECVLEPTREKVVETNKSMSGMGIDLDVVLRQTTGYPISGFPGITIVGE